MSLFFWFYKKKNKTSRQNSSANLEKSQDQREVDYEENDSGRALTMGEIKDRPICGGDSILGQNLEPSQSEVRFVFKFTQMFICFRGNSFFSLNETEGFPFLCDKIIAEVWEKLSKFVETSQEAMLRISIEKEKYFIMLIYNFIPFVYFFLPLSLCLPPKIEEHVSFFHNCEPSNFYLEILC